MMIPINFTLDTLSTLTQASFFARGYLASPELVQSTARGLERLKVPTDGQELTQVIANFGDALTNCAHD